MARNLLIMLSSGPETPNRLGSPLHQALVAKALDVDEVTMLFTGDATRLLKKGVAEKLFVEPESNQSAYELIREAKESGVNIHFCPASLKMHGLTPDDLIPECDGGMGAAGYTTLGLDPDTAVFCY